MGLICTALYNGPGINETWIVNNTAPHYRRATFLGVSQSVGNVAGVVAGQVSSAFGLDTMFIKHVYLIISVFYL